MTDTGLIIGRLRERAVLETMLTTAAGGQPAGSLIVGSSAIGKSVLWRYGVTRASAMGFTVHAARAEPFERDVPFATLRDATGRARTDQQGVRVPAGRWQEEVQAAALLAACNDRPVLVAIDDLHETDTSSACVIASLLQQAGDGAKLAVIVTLADDSQRGARRRAIDYICAHPALERIPLLTLPRPEANALVTSCLGGPLPPSLDEMVWAATLGHPGYAVEAARSIASYPTIEDAIEQIRADPDRLVVTTPGAITGHLEGMGADAAALARALSVTDRFGIWLLPVMADLAGLDLGEATRAFDALYAAGVLTQTTERDEYAFTYPIVRSTIHSSLGPATARRAHAIIAQRLRARGLDHPHAIVALAPHLAASADHGDEEAVAELVRAADIVTPSTPTLADEWYAHAEHLLWRTHPDRGLIAAKRLRCQLAAGRFHAAVESGTLATTLLGSGLQRQDAAAGLANALVHTGRVGAALAVLDDHLDHGPVTARLLVERARTLALLDRYTEARYDARRAMTMAPGEVDIEVDALGALVSVAHAQGRPQERDALLDRQLALTTRVGVRVRFESLANAAAKLAQTGSLAAAQDAITAAEALAGDDGGLTDPQLDMARTTVRAASGDWDVVDDIMDLLDGPRPPGPFHQALLLAKAADIQTGRGELRAAGVLVERLQELPVHPLLAAVAAAGVHLSRDDPERAAALLSDRCALDAERGRRIGRPFAALRLIDAYVAAGNTDAARRWAEELQRTADHVRFPLLEVCAARSASLVLGCRSDRAAGSAAAAHAIAVCRRYGYVFEEARSRLEAAARGLDTAANLTGAHDVFNRLGATPWRRRTNALMRARGLSTRRARRSASGELTETEHDLVRHLGAGMTNRQIARAMSLSPKTIEAYLTRLYAKVGAASRVELIVKMNHQGALAH